MLNEPQFMKGHEELIQNCIITLNILSITNHLFEK